jgi:hypothetical protein
MALGSPFRFGVRPDHSVHGDIRFGHVASQRVGPECAERKYVIPSAARDLQLPFATTIRFPQLRNVSFRKLAQSIRNFHAIGYTPCGENYSSRRKVVNRWIRRSVAVWKLGFGTATILASGLIFSLELNRRFRRRSHRSSQPQ